MFLLHSLYLKLSHEHVILRCATLPSKGISNVVDRVRIDLQQLNNALKRERYLTPTIDALLANATGNLGVHIR